MPRNAINHTVVLLIYIKTKPKHLRCINERRPLEQSRIQGNAAMSLRSKNRREEVEAGASIERSEGVSLQRSKVWRHEMTDGNHDRPLGMDIDQFMSKETVN